MLIWNLLEYTIRLSIFTAFVAVCWVVVRIVL